MGGGAWVCGRGHLVAGNPGQMFTDDVFTFGLQSRGFPPRRRTVVVFSGYCDCENLSHQQLDLMIFTLDFLDVVDFF